MRLNARFRCEAVVPSMNSDGKKTGETVTLKAVYSEDPTHPNYSWSQATPSGTCQMFISNEMAYGMFDVGCEFTVTFDNS